MSDKRILYIQHANGLGGSCVSLLFTMQALDRRRYTPLLALARPAAAVSAFYREQGFEPIEWKGIGCWNYSHFIHGLGGAVGSWIDLARVARGWAHSEARTLALVKKANPDLVHLNSMVLAPSARALARAGIPFVWHVREQPPVTWTGWRTAIVREMLRRYPNEVIFINKADKEAWVNASRGVVVYNFVDVEKFSPDVDGSKVRKDLGVEEGAPIVLYMGGLSGVKGVLPLLEAMSLLKRRFPNVRCVAPGASETGTPTLALRAARRLLPIFGSGTVAQRALEFIKRQKLESTVLRLPFRTDVANLMAASSVVVFPAVVPHFARPAIEAAATGRPVVASRLAGLEELVEDGVSGLLVKPNDGEELAQAIGAILSDAEKRRKMGAAGRELAVQKYSARINAQEIMAVYERVLGDAAVHTAWN